MTKWVQCLSCGSVVVNQQGHPCPKCGGAYGIPVDGPR